MTALAADTDVETALGRSLTAEEAPRAEALLLLASAAVETETGYRFAPGTYTVGRKPRGGKVRLPAAVATVSLVTEVNQATGAESIATDYTLRGSNLYGLDACFVEVDFTVTATVPDEVARLVAGIVAATLAGPPVGAESATAGPFQMSFVQSSGKVYLSASDKLILRRYKQSRPPVAMV